MKELRCRPAMQDDATDLADFFRRSADAGDLLPETGNADLLRDPCVLAHSDGSLVGVAFGVPAGGNGKGWNAELSVCVMPDFRQQGLATRLYAVVLDCLRLQGYRNVCGKVILPNAAGEKLHEHFGFCRVGVRRRYEYRHGIWYDTALYERALSDHPASPQPVIPFRSLDRDAVEKILKFYGAEERS